MNIARKSPFSTHRGRKVKRLAFMLGGLSVGLLIVQGVTSGTEQVPQPVAVVDPSMSYVEDVDPVMMPAIANPPLRNNGVTGSDDSRDAETNRPILRIKTQGENDTTAVIQVAQKTATAWGTYSAEQSAEEFVRSLPHLAPGADTSILNQVKDTWAEIQDSDASASAVLSGTAPVVQALDAKKGNATVTVTVEQIRNGENSPNQVRLVIQLSRFEAERIVPGETAGPSEAITSKTAWGVVGVRQQ